MSNRRQFLGTLGKALGAGGLILPWAGKGALALPADLGKAAQIPLTAAPMPFSPECLQLRHLRGVSSSTAACANRKRVRISTTTTATGAS